MNLFKIACLTLALSVAGSAGASIPLVDVETTTTVTTPVVTTQVQSTTTTTTSNTSGTDVSAGVTTSTITPGVDVNTDVVIDANLVITEDELSTYVESQMTTDTNLKNVTHTENTVTVSYKQPAKLFGFISSSLTATAEVQADGTINVSYPWYSFLYSATVSTGDLETSLNNDINGLVTAGTTLSAQTKAQIISRIQTALAKNFTTETNTSVETETTSDTSASY